MSNNYGLKDSGQRRDFATGSRRDLADNKPRPALISPYALMRVGDHLAKGAKKYGERNWEKGQPVSVLIDSAFRHLVQYMMGEHDEDHLSAVIFGIQAVIHFEELARRGDSVALEMLDAYASKLIADDEQEPPVPDEIQTWLDTYFPDDQELHEFNAMFKDFGNSS